MHTLGGLVATRCIPRVAVAMCQCCPLEGSRCCHLMGKSSIMRSSHDCSTYATPVVQTTTVLTNSSEGHFSRARERSLSPSAVVCGLWGLNSFFFLFVGSWPQTTRGSNHRARSHRQAYSPLLQRFSAHHNIHRLSTPIAYNGQHNLMVLGCLSKCEHLLLKVICCPHLLEIKSTHAPVFAARRCAFIHSFLSCIRVSWLKHAGGRGGGVHWPPACVEY